MATKNKPQSAKNPINKHVPKVQGKAQLVIDIGTHATRAAIVSFSQGQPVIESIFSSSLALTCHSESHIEQSADDIVQKTQSVIQQALASYDKEVSHAALAIQRSTVVAWHPDGRALSQALSWQDTRAALFINELKKTPSAERIQHISGLPLSPHYGASKLRWLAHGLGDSYCNDQLRLSPLVSYVLFHLLEDQPYLCDESNAGRTQLMDIHTRQWSTLLCDTFDVPMACLPELVPVAHTYGRLKELSIELECVCGDQNAAFQYIRWLRGQHKFSGDRIAQGSVTQPYITQPCVAINAGSGAFVLMERLADNVTSLVAEDDSFAQQPFLNSLIFSHHTSVDYAQEGTVNGVGTALSWIYEHWKSIHTGVSQDDFFTYIEGISSNKKLPILFLNTIGGLGSPFWRSGDTPCFVNIKKMLSPQPDTSPSSDTGIDVQLRQATVDASFITEHIDDCILAVIESIAFLIVINAQGMFFQGENQGQQKVQQQKKASSAFAADVFISGGVSRMDSLVRIIAGLLSVPVYRLLDFDTTLLGLTVSLQKKRYLDGLDTQEKPVQKKSIENTSYIIFKPDQKTKERELLNARYTLFNEILVRLCSQDHNIT